MSDKTKAMVASFGRVFAAAALAAYLNLGVAPLDLRLEDAKALFSAGIGAALLTLINFLRSGETRFGSGSQDIGMGGADVLEPGGVVQTADGADSAAVDETPVQTDNGPREGETALLPKTNFQGEMR